MSQRIPEPKSQRTATKVDSTLPAPDYGESVPSQPGLWGVLAGPIRKRSLIWTSDIWPTPILSVLSEVLRHLSHPVPAPRSADIGYPLMETTTDSRILLVTVQQNDFAYCLLDHDDYINSLTLIWEEDKTDQPPNSIRFGISKGKSCTGGVESENQVTVNPPKGWRIVGLHGSGNISRDSYQILYPVGTLGKKSAEELLSG